MCCNRDSNHLYRMILKTRLRYRGSPMFHQATEVTWVVFTAWTSPGSVLRFVVVTRRLLDTTTNVNRGTTSIRIRPGAWCKQWLYVNQKLKYCKWTYKQIIHPISTPSKFLCVHETPNRTHYIFLQYMDAGKGTVLQKYELRTGNIPVKFAKSSDTTHVVMFCGV